MGNSSWARELVEVTKTLFLNFSDGVILPFQKYVFGHVNHIHVWQLYKVQMSYGRVKRDLIYLETWENSFIHPNPGSKQVICLYWLSTQMSWLLVYVVTQQNNQVNHIKKWTLYKSALYLAKIKSFPIYTIKKVLMQT